MKNKIEKKIKFNKKPKKLNYEKLAICSSAYTDVLEDMKKNTKLYIELFEKFLNNSSSFEVFFEKKFKILSKLPNYDLMKFHMKFFEFKFELIKKKIKEKYPNKDILEDNFYQTQFTYLKEIFSYKDSDYYDINKQFAKFYGAIGYDETLFKYHYFFGAFKSEIKKFISTYKEHDSLFELLFEEYFYNIHLNILSDRYIKIHDLNYDKKTFTYDQFTDYINIIYNKVSKYENIVNQFFKKYSFITNKNIELMYKIGINRPLYAQRINKFIKENRLKVSLLKKYGLSFFINDTFYYYSKDYFYIYKKLENSFNIKIQHKTIFFKNKIKNKKIKRIKL